MSTTLYYSGLNHILYQEKRLEIAHLLLRSQRSPKDEQKKVRNELEESILNFIKSVPKKRWYEHIIEVVYIISGAFLGMILLFFLCNLILPDDECWVHGFYTRINLKLICHGLIIGLYVTYMNYLSNRYPSSDHIAIRIIALLACIILTALVNVGFSHFLQSYICITLPYLLIISILILLIAGTSFLRHLLAKRQLAR